MTEPASPGWGSDPSSSLIRDAGRAGPLDADVAVGLLQRAQALADQGDWDIAAASFARVTGSADPELHTAALLGLAECRYRLDDEPAALQAWIAATQAPENPRTWRAWKSLAAARVRAGDMAGATRAYREAARRAPSSEQPELQSRIGWLSKEQGDDRAAQRAFGRSRPGGLAQPVVTYGLLAFTIVVSVIVFFQSQADPNGYSELEALLRLDKLAIYFDGEYWRLLSVALVHGNVMHLVFNMYALWVIGPIVEALYGPLRYLGIYALCAVAGSAASYATSWVPAVGASGAVFGLFGALLVADRVHKPALTRNARNLTAQIGILIVINLFIGFSVPGIDNAAHIGGLLAGAWLGYVLIPRGARLGSFWSRPTRPVSGPAGAAGTAGATGERGTSLRQLGGVAALVGVLALVVAISPVTWDPPGVRLGRAQPGPGAEPVRDAIGIPSRLAGVMDGGLATGQVSRCEWQVDDDSSPRAAGRLLVAQEQAPPGGDATG